MQICLTFLFMCFKALEKVLVQNIHNDLSQTIRKSLNAIPRWNIIQGSLPFILHAVHNTLSTRLVIFLLLDPAVFVQSLIGFLEKTFITWARLRRHFCTFCTGYYWMHRMVSYRSQIVQSQLLLLQIKSVTIGKIVQIP